MNEKFSKEKIVLSFIIIVNIERFERLLKRIEMMVCRNVYLIIMIYVMNRIFPRILQIYQGNI